MALPTPYWNPLRSVSRFDPLTDVEDLFRSLGGRSMTSNEQRALDMRLDVNEDEKAYRVSVDMPGVKKEDIDVSVEGNQVTISAEVKREESRENEREVHKERFSGKAFRSFTLPGNVKVDECKATYDGGVLSLTLPKMEDSQSRRISIN